MKPFRRKAFLALVLAQFLILTGMIAKRVWLLQTGTPVLLTCEPVDPRSLLSGDYVILRYQISRLGRAWDRLNVDQETFRHNATIYVALEKSATTPFWDAVAVAGRYDRVAGPGRVVIRGRLEGGWHSVRYGVETYFVPQFEGRRIEDRMREVSVEVAVASSGESAIRRLFIAGREVQFR